MVAVHTEKGELFPSATAVLYSPLDLSHVLTWKLRRLNWNSIIFTKGKKSKL
jgi:hypothetical protein